MTPFIRSNINSAMYHSHGQKLLAMFLMVLWTTAQAIGQSGKAGTIQGSIKNADESPLAGVHITLVDSDKGTVTDKRGFFEIKNLKKGNYLLQISHLSFAPQHIKVTIGEEPLLTLAPITLEQGNKNLDEVVVESTKNEYFINELSPGLRLNTPIMKTPQNIQVIPSELLESQQSINMMENITRNVSGAQMIEHWGMFARVNMRGFKLPAFRNGMNVSMPWGPLSEDMSMVDRIEFVKGPAGFMMAAGEPGGFYNVVTKKPTEHRLLEASVTTGSFGLFRGTVDAGGALSGNNKLQYRMNVMAQRQGSHREFEESSRISIVPALTYKVTDQTSVTAEFTYQQADTPIGRAYVFAPVDSGFGSLPRNFSIMGENYPNTDIKETSLFLYASHRFSEQWSINAQYSTTKYDQVGMSLWPASVADNGDVVRGTNVWDALNNTSLGQLYLSGNFKSGIITHSVLAGIDYNDKSYWADWNQGGAIDTTPFNVFAPEYGNATMPSIHRSEGIKTRGEGNNQGIESTAYYLQDELGFFENQLRLTLAARYTDASVFAYGNKTDDSKITPRVGLSFDALEDLTIYGLYDQSFSPQFGVSASGESFDPEEGIDVEGGIKKNWFNERLKTSLTLYQITKKNLLVADPENVNFSVQLGETQSKGIEFDMQGEITPQLNVVLNYANTNVEISKDTNPENVGVRVAGHARHITNGWFSYNFKAGSSLSGFGISLGYQYQADRASWNWGADNESRLPNYFRLDSGLSWSGGKLGVKVNVNNILNKHLYSGAGYSNYIYWQSEPGTNGRLTLTYKFI